VVRVRLTKREDLARQTQAFHFEKPAGFVFKPGQFVDMTLVDPPKTDEKGNKRSFSIACEPSAETLMIATRIRDSAFKRALATLPLGIELELEGPYGAFVLPEVVPSNLVFIAGGIGITPFVSMLRHAGNEGAIDNWSLFYSNRERQDAAFVEELTRLQAECTGFNFVPTLTAHQSEEAWQGEVGRIDEAMLRRHLAAPADATYYIAGPTEMVIATRQLLTGMGVDRKAIRFEVFLGY
jgi:ferredoxin-NADP reductase